jgi:tRNA A-37 threonylcarbamoyl transferase component Bud32
LLAPPAEPLRPFAKSSPRTIVRRDFPEWPGRTMIIKRYRPKSRWSIFKDFFRGPQVLRTLRRTRELEALGVPVAGVLAARVPVVGGWGEAWLIMNEVPAAQSLYDRIAECGDPLDRRELLQGLGRLMARLHDADYEHADPSLTNFLISFATPDRPAIVLIDLDGLRRRRQSLGRAAKGLRRLALRAHLSDRECLRFLIEYSCARQRPVDARKLAQAVGPLRAGD